MVFARDALERHGGSRRSVLTTEMTALGAACGCFKPGRPSLGSSVLNAQTERPSSALQCWTVSRQADCFIAKHEAGSRSPRLTNRRNHHGQSVTYDNGKIYNLAGRMHDGLVECGSAAGVTMATAPEMLLAATTFHRALCDLGRFPQSVERGAADFPAQHRRPECLARGRARHSLMLGRRWRAGRAAAGFVKRAAIPDSIAGQLSLAASLVIYFANNPASEVPSMEIPAAKSAALTTAATDSQTAVQNAKEAQETAGIVRRQARKAVLVLMSTLIANLNRTLSRDGRRSRRASAAGSCSSDAKPITGWLSAAPRREASSRDSRRARPCRSSCRR